jgi:hypothetical protein
MRAGTRELPEPFCSGSCMENVFLGCIGWYVINECQSHRIEQRLSDKRGVEQAGQARPMQENPPDDDELRCRKLRNLPVPQFQAAWLAVRCSLRRCRSSATRQRTRQNEKSRYEKNLLSRDDRRRIKKGRVEENGALYRILLPTVRGTTPAKLMGAGSWVHVWRRSKIREGAGARCQRERER